MPDFHQLNAAAKGLTVLEGVLDGDIGYYARALLQELASDQPDRADALRLYRELAVNLVEWAEGAPGTGHKHRKGSGDAWQLHLVESVLIGDNVFGRRAAIAPLDQIGASLLSMARADLERLHLLYDFTSRAIVQHLRTLIPAEDLFPPGDLPSWDNGAGPARAAAGEDLHSRFHGNANWATLLEPLARRHFERGVGEISRFRAFRWVSDEGLVGVADPDPITLEDLVGYDYQKGILLQNTEQFLAGYPCNNILLYGARGTGKSSLVKALLNAYGDRGLRLVEVARDDMCDFPRIVRDLRGRPQRFLLFADDLSYDDAELHYRELKAALEGSVEGRPENVLLYATSNRRHLIKERFRDRDTADDEIHTQDTAQEKLSLADRFGLTLSFAPPTQPEYLRMVETIASRRGMVVDRDEIQAAALRWAALHNIPSGRTARQFIDDLQGSTLRSGSAATAKTP